MSIHLQRDLDRLKKTMLTMGAMVEEAIQKSIRALNEGRPDLADEVIDGDARIDEWEVDVEDQALKILALHQPVAVDLRFIAGVMKVNSDLERMADYAVNIAERTIAMVGEPTLPIPDRIEAMTEQTMAMVRQSLDAFVNRDAEQAREIFAQDDVVDRYNVEVIRMLKARIKEDPTTVDPALSLFSASRYLERIADLATNIAEDVVYIVEGEIIRHQHRVDDDG